MCLCVCAVLHTLLSTPIGPGPDLTSSLSGNCLRPDLRDTESCSKCFSATKRFLSKAPQKNLQLAPSPSLYKKSDHRKHVELRSPRASSEVPIPTGMSFIQKKNKTKNVSSEQNDLEIKKKKHKPGRAHDLKMRQKATIKKISRVWQRSSSFPVIPPALWRESLVADKVLSLSGS